jgi:hypothetical protein
MCSLVTWDLSCREYLHKCCTDNVMQFVSDDTVLIYCTLLQSNLTGFNADQEKKHLNISASHNTRMYLHGWHTVLQYLSCLYTMKFETERCKTWISRMQDWTMLWHRLACTVFPNLYFMTGSLRGSCRTLNFQTHKKLQSNLAGSQVCK